MLGDKSTEVKLKSKIGNAKALHKSALLMLQPFFVLSCLLNCVKKHLDISRCLVILLQFQSVMPEEHNRQAHQYHLCEKQTQHRFDYLTVKKLRKLFPFQKILIFYPIYISYFKLIYTHFNTFTLYKFKHFKIATALENIEFQGLFSYGWDGWIRTSE